MDEDRTGVDASDRWDRADLAAALRAALVASGRDLAALSVPALAPFDQFHAGGLAFTRRLAAMGGLGPEMRVLDVGGGLGGPARTIAAELGCRVTVVDLAPSYVDAGRMLTELTGLADRVDLVVGDALDLGMPAGSFDAVWTQNSGMGIADKERLYAGFRRVLRPGGRLVTQEPMAGPTQPAIFPTMWAEDPSGHHLRTPDEMRATIEAAGFRVEGWELVTPPPAAPGGPPPEHTIQGLVMGAESLARIAAAARRNQEEGRILMVHGVARLPA